MQKIKWYNSLKFTFLKWFLLLSLIPIITISILTYKNSSDSFYETAISKLEDSSNLHIDFITNWFKYRELDINFISSDTNTVNFMNELNENFITSTKTTNDFIKSYKYAKIMNKYENNFIKFADNYQYIYDLFIIDTKGNILFTIAKENDLGINILNKEYSSNLFSKSIQNTLNDGKIHFSDLQQHNTGEKNIFGFLTAPIIDQNGDIIGIFAIQIKPQNILKKFDEINKKNNGIYHYIIGKNDSKLRSPILKENEVLHRVIKPRDSSKNTYISPNNEKVIGLNNTMKILGVQWLLISEMKEETILALSNELAYRAFIIAIISIIFVILVAYYVSSKIIKPIHILVNTSEKIKDGERELQIELNSKNEFALLSFSVQEMLISLKDKEDQLKSTIDKTAKETWVKTGVAMLNIELANTDSDEDINSNVLQILSKYVNAGVGNLYIYDKREETLYSVATYAYSQNKNMQTSYKLGEGIVGQVALQKETISLSNVQSKILSINSLSNEEAFFSYTLPLIHQNKIYGVLELGFTNELNEKYLKYLNSITIPLAIFIFSTQQNKKIKKYLDIERNNNILMQDKQQQLEEANSQMEEQQQQLEEANSQMEEQQQQLKENTVILKGKNEQLELSSKYKSEFLANMSHELRTPLNAIIVLSGMLEENKLNNLNDEDTKKASVIHKSGNELLTLINDVLDLSKVEAGKMTLHKDTFESSELIQELDDMFKPQANQKNISFLTEDMFNAQLLNDKSKILQILKNFISNALKFTNEGKITLHVEQVNDANIKISVSDTGIGIEENKLKSIFNAFEQADGSTSREYGGTGLGLSISNKMAEFIGGSISLESTITKGSTFSLILPFVDDIIEENIVSEKVERLSFKEENTNNKFLYNKKILVVDDDIRNIFLLSELFSSSGAQILIAHNGKEAIEALQANKNIDIILMDIMMPVMDGYEATNLIKKNKKTKHIPLIALTAKAMKEDKDQALDAGADDYITKPLDTNVLLSIMDGYLR